MRTPSRKFAALLTQLRADAPVASQTYALIDCAHHPSLFDRLMDSGIHVAGLFPDHEAEHVRDAMPYVVELTDEVPVASLIGEGHGRAWCSYVRSTQGLHAVVNHLRRYVKCRVADANGHGQDAYFAFWDPRVAADWLPTLDQEQAEELFAHVDAFFGEVTDQPEVLGRFVLDGANVRRDLLALVPEARE